MYPTTGHEEVRLMSDRLSALLAFYSPSSIVVTKERWDRATASQHLPALVREVLRVAAENGVSVQAVGQDEVRQSFPNSQNRYEIACSLSHLYPELSARLPPARRLWEPEHSSMIMFDAVALGQSYWLQQSECLFSPQEADADFG